MADQPDSHSLPERLPSVTILGDDDTADETATRHHGASSHMRVASGSASGAFTRSGTSVLFAQARLVSELSQLGGGGGHYSSTSGIDFEGSSSFELPEFSTVSLLTVWGLDCVAALFCLLLCDVYVNATPDFPLTFFLALGCHLNLMAGVFVYLLGRRKYGPRAYRFYQPFAGGVRFVTLQFFGVTSVASSLLCCTAFGLLLDSAAPQTHGFLSTIAALGLFGNILILASLRSFSHYDRKAAAQSASEFGQPLSTFRSGAALLAEGDVNALLRLLRRRPNAESALQVGLLLAQNVFSYVAINLPQLQATIFLVNLVITVVCGVLSMLFIGHRRDSGYNGLRLFLPRVGDTVILWLTRLLFLLAVFANVLLVNAGGEVVQSSSVLAVQGLNLVSCIAMLLFMRTVHFENPSAVTTLPSSVLELGALVTVATVFVIACVNVGVFFYMQNYPAGLSDVIEGTAWSYHGVLIFVSEVAQLVSLLPTPLVYMAGIIIHGSRYRMLSPQREAVTFPVLIMQGLGYLLYTAAVITFVLFLTSKVPTIGVLESNFAVLSVICMTTSVRTYTAVVVNKQPFLFSASATSKAAPSRTASAQQGGETNKEGDAGQSNSKGEDGAALQRDASVVTPERDAVYKLASVARTTKPDDRVTADAAVAAASAEQPDDDFTPISYVMNGELIISYLLCLTNVMLRLMVDVSLHQLWGDVELPYVKLITIGNLCFAASVPLAHYSARDKGIRVFHPFSGSGSFVALQVLGWMLYAMFVIGVLFGTIVALNSEKMPSEVVSAMTRGQVLYTLFGLLELLPVVLITLSIIIEARHTLASAVQQRLAKESFLELRRLLRAVVRGQSEEEKAVAQVAFQTMMAAALHSFSLPASNNMLRLYRESAAERHARRRWRRRNRHLDDSSSTTSEDDESKSDTEHDNDDRASISSDASEDVDLLESSRSNFVTRQRRQEGARVIVILLCCASAAFFVTAAFTAQVVVMSLAFAVIAMLFTTASCVGMHAGYGLLVYSHSDTYSPFMPFRGGSPFVVRQMAGWGCYSTAFLVTLISCVESVELSATAMVFAALLSVFSQVFIFTSIPLFSDRHGEPTFLEVNGEGIVAVLTFAGAFAFGRVYTSVVAFVKGDVERLHYLEDGGTARRTRVPFVLAVISLCLAVPCTLIALSRTKGQWQRAIKKEGLGEGPASGHSGSRHRRAEKKKPPQRVAVVRAVSNLLEVLNIFVGTVTPVTILTVVYYVSTHYTPGLVQMVETYTPIGFALTMGTLLLSMVPYLLNVGVPPFVVTVRVTLVTWLLYGLPVVAALIIITPCMVVPRCSTYFLFGATLVVTMAGNFMKVRFAIKLAVYFAIGYLSYQKYLFYQTSDFSWLGVARLAVVHALDCTLLGFWLLYLSTYSGKPFHTGSQRSVAFTNFARNYLFADAQRYFNFSVIVDNPAVQMRDDTTQYLFSFHPHGVFPGTALFASLTAEWMQKVGINAKRYVSTHVASIIFNVPIVRDFNLRVGALSVSRRTLEASLRRGNSVLIVTGGQAEMLHTTVSQTKMTLITQHTGFVRLAIASRVPLVPLLSFAENNVLGLVQFPRIQRVTLKILGFPFPMIPYGRFGLPVPFRTRLTVVVGTPVEIPADADENNAEDVKKLTEAYFQAVKELFYRRRAEAGYPDMELELVNDKEEAAKRRAASAAAKAAKAEKTA